MQKNGCIIYSSGDISLQDFRDKLKVFLGGKTLTKSYIQTAEFEISINKNDDQDTQKATVFPDGFLYFKYVIEIDFSRDYPLEKCVNEVAKVLKWLWEDNFPAVASCDYEDMLPLKGGYRSLGIPWPS